MRNYTFLKEPLPYTPSDYEQVKDKVVGAFKINSSLGSIYQIGTISTPGISDLDLILIFDNDVRKVDYSSFYGQLDNRDRYILMHSPFIITRNLFENMRYFYIPGDFKLLWGNHIQIKSIEPVKLLEITIVAEYILGLYFAILRALNTKVIKIRSLLCGMSALKYDLEILGLNKNNFPYGLQLVDRVFKLRKDWFEMEDKARLLELLEIIKAYPALLSRILTIIDGKVANLNVNFLDSRAFSVKYGVNSYILKSNNKRLDFFIKENFFALLLKKLPYSSLTDDTGWIFSNYFIRIPANLFFLLLKSFNPDSEPVFERRKKLIEDYLRMHKNWTGFGMLLPPLRMPIPILNFKWHLLFGLKRMFQSFLVYHHSLKTLVLTVL